MYSIVLARFSYLGSLRLRLFPARLLLALITSGSLRLRLFPARLLSSRLTSGSLRLRLFPARLLLALTTSGSLRLWLFPARLLSAQLLSRLAIFGSGSFQLGSPFSSSQLRFIRRGIIYILIFIQNRLNQTRLKSCIKKKICIIEKKYLINF
jgi:hypothetical protein